MDFGTALAIGTTLLSFTGGSGGGDSGEGGGGMDVGGSSNSSAGSMLVIKQGAKAYNTMRGENTKPFSQTSQRQETGSYYKRFANSGSTQNTTPASQAYAGYRNPDLSTAIANLVNNAQNTQMQQLMAENSVVQPNRGVGRVITRTEPSVLSSLGVS